MWYRNKLLLHYGDDYHAPYFVVFPVDIQSPQNKVWFVARFLSLTYFCQMRLSFSEWDYLACLILVSILKVGLNRIVSSYKHQIEIMVCNCLVPCHSATKMSTHQKAEVHMYMDYIKYI